MSGFLSSAQPSPTLAPAMEGSGLSDLSDDECVARLVQAVDRHDDSRLDELAALIGRLAVPIEL